MRIDQSELAMKRGDESHRAMTLRILFFVLSHFAFLLTALSLSQ
jgi:hypothetical protein